MSWFRSFTFVEKVSTFVIFSIFSVFFTSFVNPLSFLSFFLTKEAMATFEVVGLAFIILELIVTGVKYAVWPCETYSVYTIIMFPLFSYFGVRPQTYMGNASFTFILIGCFVFIAVQVEDLIALCKLARKRLKTLPPE